MVSRPLASASCTAAEATCSASANCPSEAVDTAQGQSHLHLLVRSLRAIGKLEGPFEVGRACLVLAEGVLAWHPVAGATSVWPSTFESARYSRSASPNAASDSVLPRPEAFHVTEAQVRRRRLPILRDRLLVRLARVRDADPPLPGRGPGRATRRRPGAGGPPTGAAARRRHPRRAGRTRGRPARAAVRVRAGATRRARGPTHAVIRSARPGRRRARRWHRPGAHTPARAAGTG